MSKNMKGLIGGSGIGFIILVVLMIFVGYTKVPAGFEGVKINTLGGEKGSLTVVDVGRHFYSIKYEMELFPLFKQNYVWTQDSQEGSPNDESVTFQSKESLTFNADVGISYSVNRGASADLYQTYRKGIDEITDVDMRNSVRDAFNRIGSSRSVEEIYGEGKADFVSDIFEDVSEYWTNHITVHKIYLVGEMRPPQAVKNAIAAKIEATQVAQQRRNEVEQSIAEADKQIAIAHGEAESKKKRADADAYEILAKAKAEADAIRLIQKQLSESPLYIDYVKASKWNGQLPKVTGDVIPMLNIGKE